MSEEVLQKYPYLTYFETTKFDKKIIGVIQKETSKFLWIYNYDLLDCPDKRKLLMSFAEKWWYESNHELPIEMFIGRPFDVFQDILQGFYLKDIDLDTIIGPRLNLSDSFRKRTKKKTIELVRKMG